MKPPAAEPGGEGIEERVQRREHGEADTGEISGTGRNRRGPERESGRGPGRKTVI